MSWPNIVPSRYILVVIHQIFASLFSTFSWILFTSFRQHIEWMPWQEYPASAPRKGGPCLEWAKPGKCPHSWHRASSQGMEATVLALVVADAVTDVAITTTFSLKVPSTLSVSNRSWADGISHRITLCVKATWDHLHFNRLDWLEDQCWKSAGQSLSP